MSGALPGRDAATTAPRPTRRRGETWLRYAPPLAVGVALRLANLRGQVLGGDEVHAVRVALGEPLDRILTTFRVNDNSIPLTALYHGFAEAGSTLGEPLLRAPILLVSGLLLLAAPLLARRVGADAATLFAWLVALSPELVLYARIVRPYGPAVALAFGAGLAFDRWLGSRSRGAAAGYATAASLAVWLHPVAAPVVLAPLPFAAALRLRGRGDAPSHAALLALAAVTACAMAALLLPAADSLLPTLARRRQTQHLDLAGAAAVAQLQAGTSSALLTALGLAAAARGAALLLREAPRFGAYAAWLVAAQLVVLFAAAPAQSHRPLVFQRYALFALPWLLVFVAVGLARPLAPAAGRRGRVLQGAAVAALLALLLASGPLVRPAFCRGSFAHHNDFVDFRRPPGSVPAEAVPAFYRELAAAPGGEAILEYPWLTWWDFARAIPAYQAIHGRPVRAVALSADVADPRLAFDNLFPAVPERILASDARWLLVHLDLGREEDAVRGEAALHDREATAAHRERFWTQLRDGGRALSAELEKSWGPPDRAEPGLRVWDLTRVRGERAQRGTQR